jgi:hypothetical protein
MFPEKSQSGYNCAPRPSRTMPTEYSVQPMGDVILWFVKMTSRARSLRISNIQFEAQRR